jgi:chromosome segregation ATPase
VLVNTQDGLAPLTGRCYHVGMSQRQNGGSSKETSGWVNTDIAAEALGVSSRSVRNYILNGDLVARKEKEGINERYVVSVDSLYALRDRRKQGGKLRGNLRGASRRSEGSTEGTAEVVKETAVDMLRETLARLEAYIAQNAELRARLELTERAESTVHEELERERGLRRAEVERERTERLQAQERAERLEQERARLEAERQWAEEEAKRLREELEAEQGKGFWRRLFRR